MRWIEDNTTIPHSTVNMFMTLASNSQRVENSESIRGALKLLADDKAEVRRRQISETYIPYDGETVLAPAPPPPRQPSAPVTLEAEIVEPAASRLPAKQQPEAWERTQEIASGEDRLPLDDQKTAAILEPQEFYGIILSMLPHLTKSEIKTLIETLNTRWT